MTKKTLQTPPKWDLSDFYSSTKDKKIAADIKKIETETKKFVKNYSGKIAKLNASDLYIAIKK